jgi:putative ABC transport system permease protein
LHDHLADRGAQGRDILTQFLIEAVTLSVIGGAIGILLGLGASRMLSVFAHWPTLISIPSIVAAFFVGAAVGIFFGFYPAREAARLDPIEALRYATSRMDPNRFQELVAAAKKK